MSLLHGSFVPTGGTGFFFLCALATPEEPSATKRRAMSVHPGAVPVNQIYPLLSGLPYVAGLTCVTLIPEPYGLTPTKIPGLAIPIGSAVQWLLDLDDRLAAASFRPGASLVTWSSAAKLLLEFLVRGRIAPILQAEAGGMSAGWQLAALEADDTDRLNRLATNLPDFCRAIVPPDRTPKDYRLPTNEALVTSFLQTATRSLARRFLADSPLPFVPRTALEHVVLALAGEGRPDLPTGLPDSVAVGSAFEAWAAPVLGVRGHGALRTGLRLNLPNEQQDWEIELTLQTADGTASITAQEAWDALGSEVSIGEERYSHVEQRILADLPTMARLFPPLEPLHSEAAPARLELTDTEVVLLLQEGALLLQEAQYPVLLPTGLVRTANLRSNMHLRPASAAETQFGLSQMVQVDWTLALGGLEIGFDDLQNLARQKRALVQHQGKWVQVDQQALRLALRHLEPHREQIPLVTALRLAQSDGPLQVDGATSEGWVAGLLSKLRQPGQIETIPVPVGFEGTLRPYQQRGLDWLVFLRRYGMGACLADDMGLGKTIQVIGLLLHEREQHLTNKPTLLVCPVSLVGNWRRELNRFAPTLKVMTHHGSGRRSSELLAKDAAAHDVVITTYALVARDEVALAAVTWAGIVSDEAQNLKNPLTKHSQAMRRMQGEYRIAMTGTPVENHLGDLWSICEFLNPGLLGGAEEFRRNFAIPIERYHEEEAGERLRALVQPFILRRLKTDPAIIDDLPEKLEMRVVTNLTLEQAALYQAIVEETLDRANEANGIQRHGAVLAGLTRLKQVCNHPSQVALDTGALAGRSGKLDRLVEMLEEVIEEGDRALVFTQFARFGRIMHQYLQERLGCQVLFLDGSTPALERDRLVARFQAGEASIFVLSLKAGGVGLNLTAANHVFHFDRWWNPAVEDQATDRAHRIGQHRRVLVHKLVTAGTLEERIDKLLTEKRHLSDQVIGTGEGWLSSLSTDELRALITLERE